MNMEELTEMYKSIEKELIHISAEICSGKRTIEATMDLAKAIHKAFPHIEITHIGFEPKGEFVDHQYSSGVLTIDSKSIKITNNVRRKYSFRYYQVLMGKNKSKSFKNIEEVVDYLKILVQQNG